MKLQRLERRPGNKVIKFDICNMFQPYHDTTDWNGDFVQDLLYL